MKRIMSFMATVLITFAAVAQNNGYGNGSVRTDNGYANSGYGNNSGYHSDSNSGYHSNNNVGSYNRPDFNDPRQIIVPELTVVEVGGEAMVFFPSFIRELRPSSIRFDLNDFVNVYSQTNEYFKIKGRKSGRNIQIICRYRWSSREGSQTLTHDDVFVFYANVIRVDPEAVQLPLETTVGWGNEAYLRPKLYPENAETTYTYRSSDPSVATVNAFGTVKGVGLGDAEVTVTTANGLSTTTAVTVVVPDCEKVSFDANSHTLEYVGDEADLVAKFKPEHADPILSWESSDPEIITIDDDGHAVAVAEGKCAIWLRSDNGKQYYKNFKIKKAK